LQNKFFVDFLEFNFSLGSPNVYGILLIRGCCRPFG